MDFASIHQAANADQEAVHWESRRIIRLQALIKKLYMGRAKIVEKICAFVLKGLLMRSS